MRDVQLGQVYRHFKGDYYLVEALARDSETNEPCVIYRKLYGDGGLWVRPLDMFLSPVDRENTRTPGRPTASSSRRSPAGLSTEVHTHQYMQKRRRNLIPASL